MLVRIRSPHRGRRVSGMDVVAATLEPTSRIRWPQARRVRDEVNRRGPARRGGCVREVKCVETKERPPGGGGAGHMSNIVVAAGPKEAWRETQIGHVPEERVVALRQHREPGSQEGPAGTGNDLTPSNQEEDPLIKKNQGRGRPNRVPVLAPCSRLEYAREFQ